MKILIAGGSGFVGSNLTKYLKETQKYHLTLLTRNKDKYSNHELYNDVISWGDLAKIDNYFDVIINLCGFDIAKKRWSKKTRQRLLDSRLIPTRKLVEFIGGDKTKLISTSAIGYYPFSKESQDEENSLPAVKQTFSQEITHSWENIVTNSQLQNWCITRFGVVLGNGGFLNKIIPTAKLGLGATLGKGHNLITFVHINDLCPAIEFLIHNSSNTAYNITGFSCTQRQITQAICGHYSKKLRFSMPSIFVKAIFGQMGEELLLSSQNIQAKNLEKLGFEFKYKNCHESVLDILN